MSTGGTVAELAELVDGLALAIVKHNAVIQEAEQAAVAEPDDPHWPDVIAHHRGVVAEHAAEIILLRAEIARLPQQRGPVD